jgi:hypothetical protein
VFVFLLVSVLPHRDPVPIVQPEWIVASLRAGQLLPVSGAAGGGAEAFSSQVLTRTLCTWHCPGLVVHSPIDSV